MSKATGDNSIPASWDQAKIDRLVDGEVSAAEYQELLKQFENHPDGWRACAIAFLESQALHAAMRDVARAAEVPARPTPQSSNRFSTWTMTNLSRRTTWSPVAVAATMALAFFAGRMTPVPSPTVAEPARSAVVQNSDIHPTVIGNDSALRFANHGLLEGRTAIQPQDLQWLGKMGVQVLQEHGYIPLRTEDGRLFLLPYEDVKLIPVNHQPY